MKANWYGRCVLRERLLPLRGEVAEAGAEEQRAVEHHRAKCDESKQGAGTIVEDAGIEQQVGAVARGLEKVHYAGSVSSNACSTGSFWRRRSSIHRVVLS